MEPRMIAEIELLGARLSDLMDEFDIVNEQVDSQHLRAAWASLNSALSDVNLALHNLEEKGTDAAQLR